MLFIAAMGVILDAVVICVVGAGGHVVGVGGVLGVRVGGHVVDGMRSVVGV